MEGFCESDGLLGGSVLNLEFDEEGARIIETVGSFIEGAIDADDSQFKEVGVSWHDYWCSKPFLYNVTQ